MSAPVETDAAPPSAGVPVSCPWCEANNASPNEGFCAACGLELEAVAAPGGVETPVTSRRLRPGSVIAGAVAFALAFAALFYGVRLSARTAIAPALLAGLVVRTMLLRKRITVVDREDADTNADSP